MNYGHIYTQFEQMDNWWTKKRNKKMLIAGYHTVSILGSSLYRA